MDDLTLLPSNASPTERLISKTTNAETALDSDNLIRSLYNAKTCPADLLSYLGQAVAVDQWDHTWSHELKREVIESALEIHRTKGTPLALLKALKNRGVNATLREWWQQQDPEWYLPPTNAEPGTVVIQTLLNDNYGMDQALMKKMHDAIGHAKRHSIHIAHEMGLKWDESLAHVAVAASPIMSSDLDAAVNPLHPESGLIEISTAAGGHRMVMADFEFGGTL